MSEPRGAREMRVAPDDSRPGYALVQVTDHDDVIQEFWVPRRTLFPDLDAAADRARG